MRWAAAGLAALCAWGCAQIPAASPVPSPSAPSIETLIPADAPAPAPKWSDDVDFLALREAYGARLDFAERCEAVEARAAGAALVAHRFEEVVERTGPALERCPVWSQLHLWRTAALLQLGRRSEAEVHKRWFLGLTQSILDSGDGKTVETPYVTISTGEEYALLTRLQLEPKQQFLVNGPPMLDLIQAVDESGKEVAVYFNPAWHFVRLMHTISD